MCPQSLKDLIATSLGTTPTSLSSELNNPNYCKKLILDAAGEWSTKNERFMAQAQDKEAAALDLGADVV